MKDLKKFYEDWSKTSEGDQSKWLAPDSTHYERYMSYLKMSKPYINKNSKVLDIGCGEGNLLSILPESRKFGIDIASRYVEVSKNKNPDAIIKIYDADKQIPFQDNSFDFIFCTEVIEHVNDPEHLLNEIRRVLKLDGMTLISTYNHWNLSNILKLKTFTKKYVSEDHLREYNIRSLKKEIERNQFSIIDIETIYSGKLIQKINIDNLLNRLKLNKFLNVLFKK